MIEGIANGLVEAAAECHAVKQRAAELMETVVRPNLDALAEHRLVVVPLPEHRLLHHLDKVWRRWPDQIRRGLIAFDDNTGGNFVEPDPELRFRNQSRVSFDNEFMFCNGIFNGRYFIWIDFPTVFMTIDFSDFTALGCKKDDVVAVFGRPLEVMTRQFREYALHLPVEEERDYRIEVASIYCRQWGLARPTRN